MNWYGDFPLLDFVQGRYSWFERSSLGDTVAVGYVDREQGGMENWVRIRSSLADIVPSGDRTDSEAL